MFELDERLRRDTVSVGDFELSHLLIHKNAHFPWFILVPRRCSAFEIYQLSEEDRVQLLTESCVLSEALVDVFSPDKLNIATLGNQVPQLHQHHIVRYTVDAAWPKPVWDTPAKPYQPGELETRAEMVAGVLQGRCFTPVA